MSGQTAKNNRTKIPKGLKAGYLIVLAALILLAVSRCSCLYPFNNWDDANSYLSMGKAWIRGSAVPYRDLFDQKGPYLYFLYGLASLISATDFRGVYLGEVLLLTVDLWGMYRILRLYIREKTALCLLPLPAALICSSVGFYWGGSAEELCLPFLITGLYITLKHFHRPISETAAVGENDNRKRTGQSRSLQEAGAFSFREIFIVGLLCGVVTDIKYTVIGFYFGFMVIVMLQGFAFRLRIQQRSFGQACAAFLKECGCFLVGMALPSVPWLIYFGLEGALDDWFNVYIYNNIVIYSTFGGNDHGAGFGQRIRETVLLLYWVIRGSLQVFVPALAGMLGLFAEQLMRWRKQKRGTLTEAFAVPVLFFFQFLGIYIGGVSLPYYCLPLTVFVLFAFALIGEGIDTFRGSGMYRRAAAGLLFLVSLAGAAGILLTFSLNTEYIGCSREELFQFRFAEDIRDDIAAGRVQEHPTLINFGALDAGLYTAADIDPTCYWYQTQTLPIDKVEEDQKDNIRNREVDYVLGCGRYPEITTQYYELIDTFEQHAMGKNEIYYLFRKLD